MCVITPQYVTYGNDHVHVHCAYFEWVSCDLRPTNTKVTNFVDRPPLQQVQYYMHYYNINVQ